MRHRLPFRSGLLNLVAAVWAVVLVCAPCAVIAQDSAAPPPAAGGQRSAAQLETLAQPIALHPDPLIAILLPASVYPLEIVQAARFVRDTNNLPKVDAQPWDANVKAVAKFPELVAKMDADLSWTMELGQAFLDQPKELMDAIQALRAKAQKAGTLQTSTQQVVVVTNTVVVVTNVTQVVTVTNTVVQIQPSNPQVVYVPTYPTTVYYPPPAYVYNPYAPLVTFGMGVAVGAIIANNCDWHGGGIYVGGGGMVVWGGGGHSDIDVDIDIDKNVNINRGTRPTPTTTAQKWQPDANRMRTSGAPTASTRDARGWSGTPAATPRPTTTPVAARPTTGNAVSRPGVGNTPAARPATGAPRPAATPTPAARPAPVARPAPAPAPRPAPNAGGSAFGGMNQGSASRTYSNRGAASRGGGGGFRGGGRR